MKLPLIASLCLLLQGYSLAFGLAPRHYGLKSSSSLSSAAVATAEAANASSSFDFGYGADMNQEDMMESDLLVIVDHNDNVVELSEDETVSKKAAHTFSGEQPR